MLHKMKRFCSIILAMTLLVTSLACCNSEEGEPGTGDSQQTASASYSPIDPLKGEGGNGQIKLKVWAPEAAVSLFKDQCNAFSESVKSFGDVKVEVVPQGESDAASMALTDPESAADVFGFSCDNINKLVNNGIIHPITGDDKTKTEEENSEDSVNAATYGNFLYAYPETGDNSFCLVYDKDVVSEEDAKTFEGVLKACKAANKKFVMSAEGGFYATIFLFTGGVRLNGIEIDDDGYEVQQFNDYDEKTVVKTMMAFRNLLSAYKDTFLNGDVTKIGDGFKSGTVGAGFDGSWNFKVDKKALGKRAGFAVLPTINVDGEDRHIINMFGYKLIGVNSFTKYPETANALAKYLAGEECQREKAEKLNWGPSNLNVAESDLIKNDEAIAAILAQAEFSVPQTSVVATLWSPLKVLGGRIIDFDNPLTESECTELLHTTIANIRDE